MKMYKCPYSSAVQEGGGAKAGDNEEAVRHEEEVAKWTQVTEIRQSSNLESLGLSFCHTGNPREAWQVLGNFRSLSKGCGVRTEHRDNVMSTLFAIY